MRVFKQYLPLMVAKHVKTFYQGHIYIQGSGQLEFSDGRVLMPAFDYKKMPSSQQIAIKELQSKVREVNQIISKMVSEAA